MNLANHIGAGNAQQVVIPLEELGVSTQPLISKVFLFELVGLDHRPHTTIKNEVSLT